MPPEQQVGSSNLSGRTNSFVCVTPFSLSGIIASDLKYPQEIDPACRAIAAALEDDPFYRAISGGEATDAIRRRNVLTKYFDFSIREGREIGRCVHLADPAIGAAVWILPQSLDVRSLATAKKRAFLQSTLDPEGVASYYSIVDFMSKTSTGIVNDKTWYLSIVGVDPAQQGQGLGCKLLEPTLAEADALAVNCYLETFSPRSEHFYERLGFSVRARFTEPATGADYALMLRL